MEKVVSLYLNKDRIYFTKMRFEGNDWTLEKIDSTSLPLLFDDSAKLLTRDFQNLNNIFKNIGDDFHKINIVYPSDYSLISRIPYSKQVTPEEIAKLLELETVRTYPDSSPEDFQYNFYMVSDKWIMTIISPTVLKEQMNGLLSMYGKELKHFLGDNLTSANLFCNNYPEKSENYSAIIGLTDSFISLDVLFQNQLVHSSNHHFTSNYAIVPILEREVQRLLAEEISNLNGGLYLYGSELTKDILRESQLTFSKLKIECQRLNPFRSVYSELTERELEYASRAMQNFAPVIGSVLPEIIIQK